MSDQFLGEIRPFAFGIVPKGWAQCNGQLLAVSQNQALFSLLGVTYGGNGAQNFGLPDLRGRVSLSSGTQPGGSSYSLGQHDGEEQHSLLTSETPAHTHPLNGNNSPSGVQSVPSTSTAFGVTSDSTGAAGTLNIYGTGAAQGALASQAVGTMGTGQGHENRMPYLAVNYCIALQGIYPSRP